MGCCVRKRGAECPKKNSKSEEKKNFFFFPKVQKSEIEMKREVEDEETPSSVFDLGDLEVDFGTWVMSKWGREKEEEKTKKGLKQQRTKDEKHRIGRKRERE